MKREKVVAAAGSCTPICDLYVWRVMTRRAGLQNGALLLLAAALLLGSGAAVRAQDLTSFEKRVTVKVLDNGLTVVVCERHEAPVFSFFTHVDVGADREYPGITGLAHMFEHMAFKGTDKIGTTNYPEEKVALEKVEQAYAAYDAERRKEFGSDPAKVADLKKGWQDAARRHRSMSCLMPSTRSWNRMVASA